MESLHNGFTLDIPAGAFPLSTDSMVLADFVRLPRRSSVLDLGSGCGTLGLLLCARDPGCSVTGVELSPQSHIAAGNNIAANGLQDRMVSICADLRSFSPGNMPYDVCVSNPPYFSGGPASVTAALARRDDCCSADDLFAAAARCLRFGGDFFLVHKPEKLALLCTCASRNQLEPKRLCLVRHRIDKAVALVLLQCRKGAKPGLVWEELSLLDRAGAPTADYKRIYHL